MSIPVLMLKSKQYIIEVMRNRIAEGFDTPKGVRWRKPPTTTITAEIL
jgi:hypothetical protein